MFRMSGMWDMCRTARVFLIRRAAEEDRLQVAGRSAFTSNAVF